uniref:M-phase-specific PLK1-interacting protein-like n=1 Tax=Jaculus jaculus TaxID=51337 RepID=UPI001E1B35C4|nr:M-phase-specific PLK1-interacting protein-like [Jaculus jaculus]
MGVGGWDGRSGVPGTLDGNTPGLPSPRGGCRRARPVLPYPSPPASCWSSRSRGRAGDQLGPPPPGGHPRPFSQSPAGWPPLLHCSPWRWQQQQRTHPPHPTGKRGGERRMADKLQDYFKPSMLQDPWAGLEPVSAEDVSQPHGRSETFTDRRGRRSC